MPFSTRVSLIRKRPIQTIKKTKQPQRKPVTSGISKSKITDKKNKIRKIKSGCSCNMH